MLCESCGHIKHIFGLHTKVNKKATVNFSSLVPWFRIQSLYSGTTLFVYRWKRIKRNQPSTRTPVYRIQLFLVVPKGSVVPCASRVRPYPLLPQTSTVMFGGVWGRNHLDETAGV